MAAAKDVLDGWCVYVERPSGNASNSSDSESIEIISEDEAGNYQVYSKKYFCPNACLDEPGLDYLAGDTQAVSEIKEYLDNDPCHQTVEEGKEAQEKEVVGEKLNLTIEEKKSFHILKPENFKEDLHEVIEEKKFEFLKPENFKEEIHEANEEKKFEFLKPEKAEEKLHETIEEKKSFEFSKPDNTCDNGNSHEIVKNLILPERNQANISTHDSVKTISEVSQSDIPFKFDTSPSNRQNTDNYDEKTQEWTSENSLKKLNCAVHTEKNSVEREPISGDAPTEDERSAIETTSASILSSSGDNTSHARTHFEISEIPKTEDSVQSNIQGTAHVCKAETENGQSEATETQHEEAFSNWYLSQNEQGTSLKGKCRTSSSSPVNIFQALEGIQKTPKASCTLTLPKKVKKNQSLVLHNTPAPKRKCDILDEAPSSTENLTSQASTSVQKVRKRIRHGKYKKSHNSSSSGNDETPILTNESLPTEKTSQNTSDTQDPPPDSTLVPLTPIRSDKDISNLALITIIGCVIYLVYSVLNLPTSSPVHTTEPRKASVAVPDDLALMKDRYAQLVADWEAKVLENAELDFQIALREKSAELSRATRQNLSRPLSTRVSLPRCIANHLVPHMFSYLRQYPPDISDLTSWSKRKFCVDLSLLLEHMRVASYSKVLKLLEFLASPSTELDLHVVFEHYIAQQKIHINQIVQQDYPEIYRGEVYHSTPRPCMYCVSMQRFSLLKSRYAPGRDNMAALLTLGRRYMHDSCLQALANTDGRLIDNLYEMALEVLLSRSVSTAITLDPSLLHDYYLELTLSNEDNLRKLSRQLFKYNILAIQKFNLTTERTSKKNRKKDMKVKTKRKYMLDDGTDQLFVENSSYKDVQVTSLGKEHVELVYDTQLREISNGYSSKVSKFLADINKDLKHALCYPYANDRGIAPLSEQNESLVRFIRSMCRSNVLKNNPDEKFTVELTENKTDDEINRVNLASASNLKDEGMIVFGDKVDEEDSKENERVIGLPSIFGNVEYMKFVIDANNPISGEVGNHSDKRWNKVSTPYIPIDNTTSEDNFIEVDNNEELDTGYNRDPELHVVIQERPEDRILLDPNNHVYLHLQSDEKNRVLLHPDDHLYNTSKDKIKQVDDEILLDDAPKGDLNNKTPDLWILDRMANSFGMNADVEDTVVEFNSYFHQDKNDNSRHVDEYTREALSERFDKYDGRVDKKERKNKSKKYDQTLHRKDRVNVYDTIQPQRRSKSQEKENIRDGKKYNGDTDAYNRHDGFKAHNYDGQKKHFDGYDTKPRINAYDTKPRRNEKEYISWPTEERIVHINGNENQFTRHVYIDNVEHNKRKEEMDWWLNRRAKLRAKLRKKHDYPSQDPEFQYDYLYE